MPACARHLLPVSGHVIVLSAIWICSLSILYMRVLHMSDCTFRLQIYLSLRGSAPLTNSLSSAELCLCCFPKALICRPFLNLLGDESNAVRVEVMASLVQTLDQFCIANEEARTRAFADFLPALLAADAGCGYCWRIHHHLMLALPHFVHMFTSDEVSSTYVLIRCAVHANFSRNQQC